mgnify:CR=1 FL=1
MPALLAEALVRVPVSSLVLLAAWGLRGRLVRSPLWIRGRRGRRGRIWGRSILFEGSDVLGILENMLIS